MPKPLTNYTNVDKAKLLFDLFPNQKQNALECAYLYCVSVTKNGIEPLKAIWTNGFFAPELWFNLCDQLQNKIETKSYKKMSDLAEDMLAVVFNETLIRLSKKTNDKKFKSMIETLYL